MGEDVREWVVEDWEFSDGDSPDSEEEWKMLNDNKVDQSSD